MKRIFSIIMIVALALSMMVTLTACSDNKAVVESVLEINSDYSGHRKITIKYPLDVQIDALSKELEKNNPLVENESSTFEYKGVEADGYVFVMDIVFDSRYSYLTQISQLVGREVVSDMYQPQSVMCTGTRMIEDFDVADIIKWITDLSQSNDETDSVKYDYGVNTVSINGTVFNTESTIDISQREGKAVDSISVQTTNLKDGTYDRTVSFLIPDKTYKELKGSIEPYFDSITPSSAQYSDWTNIGENWEYKVILKSLSIEELSECTAMLFDTDEDTLFYGDRDNSSTPLTEGLVFEEEFNTFSFMTKKGESTPISYEYALPVKTTHGDGSVFCDKKWTVMGEWNDGVYSVSTDSDIFKIRVPDGIQYSISGIRMNLDIKGKNDFVRNTEFLYSRNDSMDAVLYAKDYFEKKGAVVEVDEDSEHLICRVICEGDSNAITDQLVKYFGSGNFMTYSAKDRAMSLSQKTKFTEYVDLSYMLNADNAQKPITYTVSSSCEEKIISLSSDDSGTQKAKTDTKKLTVNVVSGDGTVEYKGNIPNIFSVVIYCVAGAVMLAVCIAAIVMMLKKQSKSKNDSDCDLSQTTVFSISDLKERSDEDYLEEINADIEKQIDAMGDDGEMSELERIFNSDEE